MWVSICAGERFGNIQVLYTIRCTSSDHLGAAQHRQKSFCGLVQKIIFRSLSGVHIQPNAVPVYVKCENDLKSQI